MRLSDHFSLEEFTGSDTAERLGLGNALPQELMPNALVVATGMEQVRTLLGHSIHVNSGYRCMTLERVLCDKDYGGWCARHRYVRSEASWLQYFAGKAHPKMWSVDFTCADFGTPAEVVKKLVTSDIQFDQLILEGRWVHISFAPTLRHQVLTADFLGGIPHYTAGVTA